MNNYPLWWPFFLKKELPQIYFSTALHSFGISLLGLFIPLYLYQERGFSLVETFSFFILYSLIFALFTPLAAKFSAQYGAKHVIIFSIPLYLIFVALLYLLSSFPVPLSIIAVFLGTSQAFYWLGLHLCFLHASDNQHRGEEVGLHSAASLGGSLFGPFIGGAIIVYLGFTSVFILVTVLLIASAFILFLSKENHYCYNFSLKSIINFKQWRNSLFFVARGAQVMAQGVVWPIFIFFILKDYLSLGLIGTIISLISAILFWLVGKYSDRQDKRKIIRFVFTFESLSWIIRAFVTTVSQVFVATIFGAITHGFQESPVKALEYDQAKKNIASYLVNREIFMCIGRILILTFILLTGSLAKGLIFQGFMNIFILLF